MKIPFDIKFKPQVESGEYKVETRDGRSARFISFDSVEKEYVFYVEYRDDVDNDNYHIDVDGGYMGFSEKGECYYDTKIAHINDLFLIIPEPELSEFEKKLSDVVGYAISLSVTEPKKPTGEFVKEYAAELLALARKELEPEIKAEALKEIEQDPESSYAFKRGVEYGKEKALKDLPMWKPAAMAYDGDRLPRIDWMLNRLVARFEEGIFYLDMNDLYKLPGFND